MCLSTGSIYSLLVHHFWLHCILLPLCIKELKGIHGLKILGLLPNVLLLSLFLLVYLCWLSLVSLLIRGCIGTLARVSLCFISSTILVRERSTLLEGYSSMISWSPCCLLYMDSYYPLSTSCLLLSKMCWSFGIFTLACSSLGSLHRKLASNLK